MIFVNEEPIDPALIEDTFQRLKTEAEMRTEVSCCERDDEFLAAAEEEVIDGILLAQEAEKRHPTIDEASFRPAFEKLLRQWREHGASWDLLDAQHAQLHLETTASLRMERFTSELFTDITTPTAEEIQAFYDEHSSEFFLPPTAKALHLVRFPDHAAIWNDYSLMLQWRDDVAQGRVEFSEIARQHTQKNHQEIDLGWITMERLQNPFEAILFSLRQGEISPIIFYENALHLVYPTEVKPAVQIPLSEKSDEIAHRITLQKKQRILRALAAELREKSVITRD